MIRLKNSQVKFYGKRGMTLEEDINLTNEYYNGCGIALICKKPVPIKVLKVNNTKTRILDGYFEKKSTLDYNGIYKGRYIEFDAKETDSKTSFPISNIHTHQIEHIKNILRLDGVAFLIVRFNLLNKTFLLDGKKLINFLDDTDRKSIPLSFFEDNCLLIELKYAPRLDYLKLIDIL